MRATVEVESAEDGTLFRAPSLSFLKFDALLFWCWKATRLVVCAQCQTVYGSVVWRVAAVMKVCDRQPAYFSRHPTLYEVSTLSQTINVP